uniref:Uncharacterized protein n=1 Tax=Lotharella oceanica TaxID=641309 RepID=A0A7S2TY34_9EUKA|mmetsp:Transcript_33376/g.62056  ORF Transcript_33376/g.62056 Transcript_33376/m.62056 type:complete len:682 (+) Transcript_33376:35-2080(+)
MGSSTGLISLCFIPLLRAMESSEDAAAGGLAGVRANARRPVPQIFPDQVVMTQCDPESGLNGLAGVVRSNEEDDGGKLAVHVPSFPHPIKMYRHHLRPLHKMHLFEPGDQVQVIGFTPLPMLEGQVGRVVTYPEPLTGAVSVKFAVRVFPYLMKPCHLKLIVPERTPEILRRQQVDRKMSQYEEDDYRHWINRIDETFPGGALVRPWRAAAHNILKKLVPGVRRPNGEDNVYTGVLGVSLAIWTAVDIADLGSKEEKETAFQKILYNHQVCLDSIPGFKLAFLSGRTGALCLRAAVEEKLGNFGAVKDIAWECLTLSKKLEECLSPSECDLAAGKAGYLYSIAFLRVILDDPKFGSDVALNIINDLISRGQSNAPSKLSVQPLQSIRNNPSGQEVGGMEWKPKTEEEYMEKIKNPESAWRPLALYFETRDEPHLGAHQGILGILTAMLHFPKELDKVEDGWRLIESTLRQIVKHRHESGNIRRFWQSPSDTHVQWCSGSPGIIVPLLMLGEHRRSVREEMMRAAEEAGEVTWVRGMLSTKGLGLCHGICGNGLAMLHLYRSTGSSLWLDRARHFGRVVLKRFALLENQADSPSSLFEGRAGALVFFAALAAPEKAWFPGYACPPPRGSSTQRLRSRRVANEPPASESPSDVREAASERGGGGRRRPVRRVLRNKPSVSVAM